jgi:hypothetical protein
MPDADGRLTMAERWQIDSDMGWGPRPLSEEQLALQAADKMPVDTVEHLRLWLDRHGMTVADFKTHPVYFVLCQRYPHLRDL